MEEQLASSPDDVKIQQELAAMTAALKDSLSEAEQNALRQAELKSIDWGPLWTKPAIFAGVVMLIFIVFFKDGRSRKEVAA